MTNRGTGLLAGGIGAALLCAAATAHAQDNASAPVVASPPPAAAPPPLRDFRLPGRTVVQQPAQPQPAPVEVAPPPPVTVTQPVRQPRATPPQARAAPPPAAAQPVAEPQTTPPTAPRQVPAEPPTVSPADATPSPAPPAGEPFPWLYLIPAAALALLGLTLFRGLRRRRQIHAVVEHEAAAAAPAAKPEPQLRPWLELELKAERAQSTDAEAMVQFVLEITNTGKAPARNLRIDVKMLNAGQEQDKEIGSFFRTAGRESTKCSLPGIAPGMTGAIKGEVAMPREEMRAVVLDNKYLFVPVIAVNALYDWGEGRTGQTSKSYLVGRELEQPSAKMGAFRVDQGPRIWRTVGQRQHKLARRV